VHLTPKHRSGERQTGSGANLSPFRTKKNCVSFPAGVNGTLHLKETPPVLQKSKLALKFLTYHSWEQQQAPKGVLERSEIVSSAKQKPKPPTSGTGLRMLSCAVVSLDGLPDPTQLAQGRPCLVRRANKKLEKAISAREGGGRMCKYPRKCHIIQIIKPQPNSHLFKADHFTEE